MGESVSGHIDTKADVLFLGGGLSERQHAPGPGVAVDQAVWPERMADAVEVLEGRHTRDQYLSELEELFGGLGFLAAEPHNFSDALGGLGRPEADKHFTTLSEIRRMDERRIRSFPHPQALINFWH